MQLVMWTGHMPLTPSASAVTITYYWTSGPGVIVTQAIISVVEIEIDNAGMVDGLTSTGQVHRSNVHVSAQHNTIHCLE